MKNSWEKGGKVLKKSAEKGPLLLKTYSRDLFRTINARAAIITYLKQHPMWVTPNLEASRLDVFFHSEGQIPTLSKSGKWDEVFAAAREEADRLFTSVIASNWKESICKCRYSKCGKYFFQRKPRKSYTHGTFCTREHQRLESAAVCTKMRRTNAHLLLIKLAGNALVSKHRIHSSTWQGDTRLKGLIASELSMKVSKDPNFNRQEVKINWVTRHRQDIEQKRTELEKSSCSDSQRA